MVLLEQSAVAAALRRAGKPLTRVEIRVALNIPADDAQIFHAMVGRLPFVEVNHQQWGLVERDVPGGQSAYEFAIMAVGRAKCVTALAARSVIARLSSEHASWSLEMSASAYRTWKVRRSVFGPEPTGIARVA